MVMGIGNNNNMILVMEGRKGLLIRAHSSSKNKSWGKEILECLFSIMNEW